MMKEAPIETGFTRMIGCDYPIIAAPMFLVSNEAMVVAASNSGAVGAAPSLNWRSSDQFTKALEKMREGTSRPYAINLIVNKSNLRFEQDLEVVCEHKVPLVITSLGNPEKVINAVHAYGGKVFCDVTNLEYAQKVESLGADGVIAVSSGAGGHAGPISPMVLIPYLKKNISIPIVAAGGIATGAQMLAAIAMGASAVQVGTRFITSEESRAAENYKEAILQARPEDIVLTSRISGTPASVINTPYIKKMGVDLPWWEKVLRANKFTSKYAKIIRYTIGAGKLSDASKDLTWKTVWSAGQGAGLVDNIQPCAAIIQTLVQEYRSAYKDLSL